jgi:hypothetical protein
VGALVWVVDCDGGWFHEIWLVKWLLLLLLHDMKQGASTSNVTTLLITLNRLWLCGKLHVSTFFGMIGQNGTVQLKLQVMVVWKIACVNEFYV